MRKNNCLADKNRITKNKKQQQYYQRSKFKKAREMLIMVGLGVPDQLLYDFHKQKQAEINQKAQPFLDNLWRWKCGLSENEI